jgi:hypothetical protein
MLILVIVAMGLQAEGGRGFRGRLGVLTGEIEEQARIISRKS